MTLEIDIPMRVEHKIHRIYHHHHYHHLHQTLEHHHLHIHNQSIYRHKSHGHHDVECLGGQPDDDHSQQPLVPTNGRRQNLKAISDKPMATMKQLKAHEKPLDQKEFQLQQYIDQSCGNSIASNSSCSGSDSDSSCSGDGYQFLQANGLTHLIARHNQREQLLKQQKQSSQNGLLHNHNHSTSSSSTTTTTTSTTTTTAAATTTTTTGATPSISSKQRSQIRFILMAALTYILSPIDLIPEAIFGIVGILDDIVFLVMCLFCVVVILIYPLFRELRRTMLGRLGFKQQQQQQQQQQPREITMNSNKDSVSS